MKKVRIIISVTSDLVTDQRVHKAASFLFSQGHSVLLIGRKKKDSLDLEPREYPTKRMRLVFEKGPLFYAEFNLRLFLVLLFKKSDIFLANDLDSVLPNFLVARIKGKKIVYDNHEYYTGVPELQNRPLVRKIWKSIEKFVFPRIENIYTVNQSIANLYHLEYGNALGIVRNIPPLFEVTSERPKEFPANKKIVLYQGAGINVDRGVEELIDSMAYMGEDVTLVIIGGGDVIGNLTARVRQNKLDSKVIFIPKLPFQELKKYTIHADLGVSLDKGNNINYRFSLPNKIFDYLHAGLPVLVSRLPELERIVEDYKIGDFISSHDPKHIAEKINFMFSDQSRILECKQNSIKASKVLNWQEEQKVLHSIFQNVIDGK